LMIGSGIIIMLDPKALSWPSLPIGSMYAIYGNIYHQYTPNGSIYTIHGSYGLWETLWAYELQPTQEGWQILGFEPCFHEHVPHSCRSVSWLKASLHPDTCTASPVHICRIILYPQVNVYLFLRTLMWVIYGDLGNRLCIPT
jgi:hypothetical protein